MRYIGAKVEIPVVPDAVAVFALAANTAQAADYISNCDYVRVTFVTSAGAAHSGVFNGNSTGALWGSTHTATAGSSAADSIVPADGREFQRGRASTGYSVIAPTSGYCSVEQWGRAGTT